MGSGRVVIAGHVTHDRFGDAIVAGGSAFYGTRIYRELGAEVHLATSVGDDFLCDSVFDDVGVSVFREGKTTLFSNLYPREGRRIQCVEAVAPGVPVEILSGLTEPVDLLHLAPVIGEIDLAQWKNACKARITAISVQGWIRKRGRLFSERERSEVWGLPPDACYVAQRVWDVTADELQGIDVACLSHEDLVDQGDLLDRLLHSVPLVALTLGVKGCDLWVDGSWRRVGIHPIEEVDPTGAGDSFASGLLYGLMEGWSPVDAARFGAAGASIVIEGRGGEAIHRLDEARERMHSVPVEETTRQEVDRMQAAVGNG